MEKKQNTKLDLGWGNPYFLLENLNLAVRNKLNVVDYMKVVYEPDEGNEKLLEYVKNLTESLTGYKYKHYLITNGATQALNTIMRVWKIDRGVSSVVTSKLGYPFYPNMIEKSLLARIESDLSTYKLNIYKEMMIIDSPSNPLGEQQGSDIYIKNKPSIVWDAVYHNPIYNANMGQMPNHEVYVNSFSKLLGVTGARVGWIATNSEYDYNRFKEEALYENATVSQTSQKLVVDTLDNLDINNFVAHSRRSLERNRDIISQVTNLIGTDVQEVGMFYCSQVDQKMLDLLDKCDINYVTFNSEGNRFVRLNIGQTSDILLEAVKRIQRVDRSK
jgi:aspartate/methionine/tyrosine aminotransferase